MMRSDSLSGGRRLLVTLAVLIGYRLLYHLPVPGFSADAMLQMGWASGQVGVVLLGISPWIVGFLLVELVSFTLPWGRRCRAGGVEGRRRLNVVAIRLSLVFTLAQTQVVASFFERQATPAGEPLVTDPGILFRAVFGLTILAGTAIVFLLASAISRWGIGNGFCLLWVSGLGFYLVSAGGVIAQEELLAVIAAALILSSRFWREESVVLRGAKKEEVRFVLPAFQQGVIPLALAAKLVPVLVGPSAGNSASNSRLLWGLAGTVILIVLLSWFAFLLFSSRKRLERNLPARIQLPQGEIAGGRSWIISTGLLLLFGLSFLGDAQYWRFWRIGSGAFLAVFLITATVFDLVQEWRFREAHRQGVTQLLALDNVHLASYLRGLLRAHGVESLAKTYHFRSLFYFWMPLIKIDLLVPSEEFELARQVVSMDQLRTV